ncbi:hypothetical protein PLESTB_000856000 [Pleodorina starrii]|uniref:PUB domain-containing protein n=1 Tax=Pleodorina starrii TaxID=330485 RepID=A0A9W6BLL8_9CHLO|nr:hypothetical protein PLESTM_001437800 [Pleodorina starrii]GLC54364.1 hypothetical protein PLESTB_000856000 [Pleodorina starrii]GLC72015.1 hypothetical protein PLESTF_001195200 [Pleodorina starrii]
MPNLEERLLAKGVNADVAKACTKLFGSYEEAFPYIDPPVLPGDIKEFYSLKYQRYYYHSAASDSTSWELPPQLQLTEWLLDASISGQDVAVCRRLLSALLWAVQANAHKGEALWSALGLLGRLTANIVDCGNTVDKYRTVKKSNPKIRDALSVVHGGEAVLLAAGFVEQLQGGDTLVFPPPEATPDMRPLTTINAKLQQLTTRKGFTGTARDCDDTGSSTRSRHSGQPGFRYQSEIFECSCCSRPINDGSDRLVTRKHDTPRGEFRFMDGSLSPSHSRDHAFHTHHPKASQHNLHSNVSDTNPWGVLVAGGSAARARERLKQRTGL